MGQSLETQCLSPLSLGTHMVPRAVVCLPRVAGPMPRSGCCRHRCSQLPFWVPGLDFPRLVSGAGPKQQYYLEQVSSESGRAREGREEEEPESQGRGLDTGQLLRRLLTLVRSRSKPRGGSTGSEREASGRVGGGLLRAYCFLKDNLFIHPSTPPVLSSLNPSTHLPIIHPSNHLPILLSIHIHPSIHPSSSILPFFHSSVHPPNLHPFMHLSIHSTQAGIEHKKDRSFHSIRNFKSRNT